MKPQIIRFALACAVFVLAGCYEDKGNYDYHDVNGVKIEIDEP